MTGIRVAAAALNGFTSLAELYLASSDQDEPELRQRLEDAAGVMRAMELVSAGQVQALLAHATWARGADRAAAQGLWTLLAEMQQALVDEHEPARAPEHHRW